LVDLARPTLEEAQEAQADCLAPAETEDLALLSCLF
jgi:hypothetical protein